MNFAIQIGHTLHVLSGTEGDEEEFVQERTALMHKAHKHMARGGAVECDGKREWYQDSEHYPLLWHDDNERTRHTRYHVTKTLATDVVERHPRKCMWKKSV